MGWHRPVEKLAIKRYIRQRDGSVCVVCGLDEATQRKRYGKTLEVHRTVPKSEYSTTLGVCLPLCNVCHDALHGQGNWGWVMMQTFFDDDDLLSQVRRATRYDAQDERTWRRQEAWGAKLKALRIAKYGKHRRKLKMHSLLTCIPWRSLDNFECGRRVPSLFEAKQLAQNLGVTLDQFAAEEDVPDEHWMDACARQSSRRALVLRCRVATDADEALSRGAQLAWNLVKQSDDAREAAEQAAAEAERERQAATKPIIFRGRAKKTKK